MYIFESGFARLCNRIDCLLFVSANFFGERIRWRFLEKLFLRLLINEWHHSLLDRQLFALDVPRDQIGI